MNELVNKQTFACACTLACVHGCVCACVCEMFREMQHVDRKIGKKQVILIKMVRQKIELWTEIYER